MITIEIKAIQRAKYLEIKTDENITVGALNESIRRILKDDGTGYLLNSKKRGFMAQGSTLLENGIRTGEELIFISRMTDKI